jgi:hypothetical protein
MSGLLRFSDSPEERREKREERSEKREERREQREESKPTRASGAERPSRSPTTSPLTCGRMRGEKKPYACVTCRQTCAQFSNLARHMRTKHEGLQSYLRDITRRPGSRPAACPPLHREPGQESILKNLAIYSDCVRHGALRAACAPCLAPALDSNASRTPVSPFQSPLLWPPALRHRDVQTRPYNMKPL